MLEALARRGVGATHTVGRSWPAALGLLAAGAGLLGHWLPALARRQGHPTRADLLRQAGTSYLGFAALDLAMQAIQHPLRIAYPPLPAAWFALLLGRGVISGLAAPALVPGVPPAVLRGAGRLLLTAHMGLSLGIAYACFYEANVLRTRRVRVAAPGWAGRLRIVHLSDLHIERLTRRDRAMLARVRAARPDLLLLTGDYINADWRDDQGHGAVHAVLCALGAVPTRYGAYAVLGNVDRPAVTRPLFAGTGIRLLEEAVVRLEVGGQPVELLGVGCRHYGRHHYARTALVRTLAQIGPKRPGTLRILLHHMPDLAAEAAAAQVDLYLCGHTHGGQIRLPGLGALFTSSRYGRRYDRGLHRLPHGGAIYTSSGIGLEGLGLPRARVFCPPEVAVIEVRDQGSGISVHSDP
jgi:predicted MPP superfamily phosphohydrolase